MHRCAGGMQQEPSLPLKTVAIVDFSTAGSVRHDGSRKLVSALDRFIASRQSNCNLPFGRNTDRLLQPSSHY